jgi:hypothetical protein
MEGIGAAQEVHVNDFAGGGFVTRHAKGYATAATGVNAFGIACVEGDQLARFKGSFCALCDTIFVRTDGCIGQYFHIRSKIKWVHWKLFKKFGLKKY